MRIIKDAMWTYLYTELNRDKSIALAGAVTDAIGIMTHGEMNMPDMGFIGHETDYQKADRINAAATECFAEIGLHIMRNDAETLNVDEKMMPNSLKVCENIISKAAKYAKKHGLNY